MEIAITFELRRDSLEDNFKVCKQKILCQIPITSQMVDFVEKVVNTNIKDKEYFTVRACCSLEAYTLLLQMPFYKIDLTVSTLQTYDGDLLDIKPVTQNF